MLQQREAGMSLRKYVIGVAVVAVLVGFVLLFVPLKEYGVDCGTVGSPNRFGPALHDVYMGTFGSDRACEDALGTRQGWVIGLIVGGLVVSLGAGLTGPRSGRPDTSGDAAPA